jgi:myo-inositol-1(or 4)-monophosphatase
VSHFESSELREIATEAAVTASRLVADRFGRPGRIDTKGALSSSGIANDLVTEVDLASERCILDVLASHTPHAVVLAEEAGFTTMRGAPISPADPMAHEVVWVVDPLDGTVNFAHSIPGFAVSIACLVQGHVIAGAIVDPLLDERYTFEDNGTAQIAACDGVPLAVDPQRQPGTSMLCIGGRVAGDPMLREGFQGWRRLGSAALALAWIAAGRFGAYAQPAQLSPWDVAVGAPLVQAAGGRCYTEHGEPWNLQLHTTGGLLAGAPLCVDALRERVATR